MALGIRVSPPIHRLAAKGFDVAADAYDRGRPSYPEAAIALLVAELGICADSKVVDLGAGTGKLTRQLLPTGARIVAVEPVAGMRSRLVALAAEGRGALEVLDGSAEHIPIA